MLKKTYECLIMIICAIVCALNYKIFVFPNNFAPAGVDGICTIVQYQTNTNIGYLSLIVNVPLLVVSWFLLSKSYVIKSIIFILTFSCVNLLMSYFNISIPVFYATSLFGLIVAPIFGGVIRGALYVVTINYGGSAGGVDIIAALIRKRKENFNLMNIIFILNASVVIYAFFVYDFAFMPAICTIIYCLVTTSVTNIIQFKIKKRNEKR